MTKSSFQSIKISIVSLAGYNKHFNNKCRDFGGLFLSGPSFGNFVNILLFIFEHYKQMYLFSRQFKGHYILQAVKKTLNEQSSSR